MSVTGVIRSELLAATDKEIDDAVQYSDPLALRGLIYQLTGDESLLHMEVGAQVREMPQGSFVGRGNGLVNDADVELVRQKAAAFLKSYRDRGAGDISIGPVERLRTSLNLAAGEEISADEFDMWLEEFALDRFARGLAWERKPTPRELENFEVLVIGAGMGGLNAAILLKQAGIRFSIVEKNANVGGTWFENRYPGARVDSPSRSYLHILGIDYVFPNLFCSWDENMRYFDWLADTYDVRDDIVFNTEVKSCVWDDDEAMWNVRAVGPEGERVWQVNAVISAVGFLSRPNMPSIEGMDTFNGQAFHTARWPEGVDLQGKRVAVIGTGCSGYQTIPEIALVAGNVTIFQRTPQWIFRNKNYRTPLPLQATWMHRNVPLHSNFMRFRENWLIRPQLVAQMMHADPGWNDPDSRSAVNKMMRDGCIAFLHEKLDAKRPDLVEKMIPPHPVWSARAVMVDEDYSVLDALTKDNVELVSDPIARITPTGIVTADGRSFDFDVIVYAMGFRANDYLWPMEVRGRGGQRVEDLWAKDGPRAYLGCMLPGFPNMFLLYGPNTNPFGGLGVVSMEEMITRFVLECFQRLILDKQRSVDVTLDAYRRYNSELDEAEKIMLYADKKAKNYYRNEYGRSSSNCPFPVNKTWAWLRKPNLDEVIER